MGEQGRRPMGCLGRGVAGSMEMIVDALVIVLEEVVRSREEELEVEKEGVEPVRVGGGGGDELRRKDSRGRARSLNSGVDAGVESGEDELEATRAGGKTLGRAEMEATEASVGAKTER